jgi:hypothetical protein
MAESQSGIGHRKNRHLPISVTRIEVAISVTSDRRQLSSADRPAQSYSVENVSQSNSAGRPVIAWLLQKEGTRPSIVVRFARDTIEIGRNRDQRVFSIQ